MCFSLTICLAGALDETHAGSPGAQSSGSSERGGSAAGSGGGNGGGTVTASTGGSSGGGGGGGNPGGETALSSKQRHQMKHRELFLSRQVETLPATHIRGKCSVTLFNETESLASYLGKEDMFFYSLVFDPTQKTLLADKGEIRVGM